MSSVTSTLRTETTARSYLVLPDALPPYPGVVVIHELFGLNENIRDICHHLAEQGYAALGVDLFAGRNTAICMARILVDWLAGRLDDFAVVDLKAALTRLAERPDVDGGRLGAVGFCIGGTLALTWACTDQRLHAIAPYYGSAPRRREALRRLCPVVGSWPEKDFTTGSVGTLEIELTHAGVPHDLKIYPDAGHSFFNDRAGSYAPAAAEDSWQRVLAFFDQHVKGVRGA